MCRNNCVSQPVFWLLPPTLNAITRAGKAGLGYIGGTCRHSLYSIRDLGLGSVHLFVTRFRRRRAFLRGFLLPPRANSVRLNLPTILNEEGYQGRERKHAREPRAHIHFEIDKYSGHEKKYYCARKRDDLSPKDRERESHYCTDHDAPHYDFLVICSAPLPCANPFLPAVSPRPQARFPR